MNAIQSLINAIVEFDGPSSNTNQKRYSILMTLGNADPSEIDATDAYQIYQQLGYGVQRNVFYNLWDEFFAGTPNSYIVQQLSTKASIPVDIFPCSSFPLTGQAGITFSYSYTDPDTGEPKYDETSLHFNEGTKIDDLLQGITDYIVEHYEGENIVVEALRGYKNC